MNENAQAQAQDIVIAFRKDLDTVQYENIIGYQLGSGFLGVIKSDGNSVIYPQDLILQVNLINQE